jgi:hypothetical protein
MILPAGATTQLLPVGDWRRRHGEFQEFAQQDSTTNDDSSKPFTEHVGKAF